MSFGVQIPEDISLGNYAFIASTEYADSFSTSSYLFNVSKQEKKILSGFEMDYFVILVLVFLFGILILIAYMVYDRNKMFLELRRQHTAELRYLSTRIGKTERVSLSRVRTAPERKKVIREFKEIKKRAIRKVKERQKRQTTIFRKLKRQKKKGEMQRRLAQWKKEGFNVDELLIKTAEPTKKAREKMIGKWRKQGFDTSAMGK